MKSLKEQAVIPSLASQVVIPENGINPATPEQGSGRYKVLILNPDDGTMVEVEEWKKDPNPQRAEAVVILCLQTNEALVVSKSMSKKEYPFKEAQEQAAAFRPKGLEGVAFRCPTRAEVLTIFDADDYGFDDAVCLIAGRNDWYHRWGWTCEKVSRWWAQRSTAIYAWIFFGTTRNFNYIYVSNALQVGAVTLLKLK